MTMLTRDQEAACGLSSTWYELAACLGVCIQTVYAMQVQGLALWLAAPTVGTSSGLPHHVRYSGIASHAYRVMLRPRGHSTSQVVGYYDTVQEATEGRDALLASGEYHGAPRNLATRRP